MNNKTLIIILLCVYKIYCQQNKTKIDEESQEEEKAEERLEAEDLQKAEEDQEAEEGEAEEYENRADDKQKETKIKEESQEEEAEDRLEAENQEAEEFENRADDKQKETKIEEKSQEEEEAEERLEAENLQNVEEDQEAEEDENEADDKVEEPEKPIEEKESNESDKEQVEEFEELIEEKEMKNKLEDNISHEENEEYFPKEEMDLESQKQKEAGDPADLFGTNQHYNIPANFDDFGRRFIWAYPYIEKNPHGTVGAAELKLDRDVKDYLEAKKESAKLLTPVKAPPAFVLSIAKQSALLEGTKPKNPSEDIITRNILRTGDFWDSVWKEDVDVDRILRTSNKKSEELERVTVQVEPGSKLYELISKLKEISPTLLYVINKSNDNN